MSRVWRTHGRRKCEDRARIRRIRNCHKCLKGHKSLGSLCSVVNSLIVSGAQPTKGQGHLLSCSGQLKTPTCFFLLKKSLNVNSSDSAAVDSICCYHLAAARGTPEHFLKLEKSRHFFSPLGKSKEALLHLAPSCSRYALPCIVIPSNHVQFPDVAIYNIYRHTSPDSIAVSPLTKNGIRDAFITADILDCPRHAFRWCPRYALVNCPTRWFLLFIFVYIQYISHPR